MGRDASITVWFGLSSRQDEDLVDELCALEDEEGGEDVAGVLVGSIFNNSIEFDLGWGAEVEIEDPSFLVHLVSDVVPTGADADKYAVAVLEVLKKIVPDDADAIFQKMRFHIMADYY